MKQTILLLKGLPASGKTTFAKELSKKGWIRINKDNLREMLNNSVWSKENEKQILKVRDSLIRQYVSAGFNVVVDDTNLDIKHEIQIKNLAVELNADFEIKIFDTPLYDCIERDSKREKPVGKKVILDMYNRYLRKAPEKFELNGKKLCVVVDVDGTLAYMNGRTPFDYSKVDSDIPNKQLSLIINSLKNKLGLDIIILSGREDSCRIETGTWLYEKAMVDYDALFMRETGDVRDDTIVKEKLFNKYIKDNYQVLAVFDDRPKVIRKWKELGLFVLDCNRDDNRIDF